MTLHAYTTIFFKPVVMRQKSEDTFCRVGIEANQIKLLDSEWYLKTYTDVDGNVAPAEHFYTHGMLEGRNPNRWIDQAWYYATYPDVLDSGANAALHYLEHGCHEGRDPGPWVMNVDSAEGTSPLHGDLDAPCREIPSSTDNFPGYRGAIDFIVSNIDKRSFLVQFWQTELTSRGFCVNLESSGSFYWNSLIDSLPFFKVGSISSISNKIIISFNGEGVTPRLAKRLGNRLVVVVDSPIFVRKASRRLRSSMRGANIITSSRTVEAAASLSFKHAAVDWHEQPMSPSFFKAGPHCRATDVVWRLSCHTDLISDILPCFDSIVGQTSKSSLRLVADSRSPYARILAHHHPGRIEFRPDWNTLSGLHDCYDNAKLAIITPSKETDAEVSSDLLAALAAGALPIASYAVASELSDLLGSDFPIPLYKSFDELAAIVALYLESESERAALVVEGQRRLKALPTYATRIGELMRRLGHAALAISNA